MKYFDMAFWTVIGGTMGLVVSYLVFMFLFAILDLVLGERK